MTTEEAIQKVHKLLAENIVFGQAPDGAIYEPVKGYPGAFVKTEANNEIGSILKEHPEVHQHFRKSVLLWKNRIIR